MSGRVKEVRVDPDKQQQTTEDWLGSRAESERRASDLKLGEQSVESRPGV